LADSHCPVEDVLAYVATARLPRSWKPRYLETLCLTLRHRWVGGRSLQPALGELDCRSRGVTGHELPLDVVPRCGGNGRLAG
jgi:hypothetical protein